MKSTILQIAIPVLAALVLVGCNQNSPDSLTETPLPHSNMSNTNGTMETASMPETNGMQHMMLDGDGMSRMMPASNSMSHMNMPANTNQ